MRNLLFVGVGACMGVLAACSPSRPEQQLFMLATDPNRPGTVRAMADQLAAEEGFKTSSQVFRPSGEAASHATEIHGRGHTILILSFEDALCGPRAEGSRRSFDEGYYSVTVARTGLFSGASEVGYLGQRLSKAASQHSARLVPRAEGPQCGL